MEGFISIWFVERVMTRAYYDGNKQKECFLAVYDSVKDTIGKFYEGEPLTLNQMCHILAPMCRAIIHDHVNGFKDQLTEEQKDDAFRETIATMKYLIEAEGRGRTKK